MTIPVSQKRFAGITTSKTVTLPPGRMFGICFAAVPNPSSIAACSVSRIPSDAIELRERRRRPQRPEHQELHQHADQDAHEHVTTNAGALPSVKP